MNRNSMRWESSCGENFPPMLDPEGRKPGADMESEAAKSANPEQKKNKS